MIEYHLKIIEKSLDILKQVKNQLLKNYSIPLSEEDYENLQEENITLLDTLAFRFSKIQSILGEKLFREILEYLEIDINNKSFIEILSSLEREDIISIEKWRELRTIRNSLSHDYPEEIEYIVKTINKILLEYLPYLEEVYDKIKQKYELASKIKQRRD